MDLHQNYTTDMKTSQFTGMDLSQSIFIIASLITSSGGKAVRQEFSTRLWENMDIIV